jgi:hypothetical protein
MLPLTVNDTPTGYIPSTDFGLFQLPQFGELFANSLGIASRFQNSDPTDYVNYSINSLAQILRPQQPLSIPPMSNYGQGIELPSAMSNLAPLITPQFFQGKAPAGSNAPNPYYDPPKIYAPLPSTGQFPPVFDPNRTPQEIAKDPYGIKIINQIPILSGNPQTSGKCPQGESEYKDVFGFSHCGKGMVSDGSGSGDKRVIGDDPTKSGDKAQSISDFFKTLPEGSGIFLIAIAIIILILIFARGK